MAEESSQGAAMATAAAVLAAVPLSYYLLVRRGSKSKSSLPYPPGPKGHWLYGNMFDMPDFEGGETFDTQNLKQAKEHGLVYSVQIPVVIGRLIIISDPALARKVLATKNYPKSFFYKFLEPLVGARSLATIPTDKEWSGLRKAFNTGFAPTFLRTVVSTMSERLEYYLEAIEGDIAANVPTDMLKRSQSLTSDIIVKIAFGEQWEANAGEPHKVRVLEDEICQLYNAVMKNPLGRVFTLAKKRRMHQVGIELENEMRAILERRLAVYESEDCKQGKNTDICSLAIAHMTKESGGKLTDDDKSLIVDQLKTFYFAGHDTTAICIAWAIWELSQHPEAVARLRSELEEHGVWTDPNTPPSYEQLQKCSYLEAVVKESLRLYPPASGLSRYNDDPNDSYNGYCIGNAVLLVNAYVMHRHPQLWKNDPDSFLPERFIDGSEGDINAKFMPFSKGPRDCIGKYFAYLEAKLAISSLVMRYDMACDDPKDCIYTLLTNIPKNGAKVKFCRRSTVSN
eukprot:CAMPEP_0197436810 /NCGR_PEP_ID=MMETSP1175-20131217/4195_1 /TAXON_ID=1003142 /ORGANISM="Triceratium dubium, Strain CCMP147" /LENGTH=510 /DNA_ID=CAMNT_0042966191 /DNA_START=80 /DNA_END=1612 /DNA_ORIENTATION=+